MCMDDDYMHAKRSDKAVPLNSRRRKNGKASDVAWHLNNEAETVQNSNQEMTVQLIRRQMSVITGSTDKIAKGTFVLGVLQGLLAGGMKSHFQLQKLRCVGMIQACLNGHVLGRVQHAVILILWGVYISSETRADQSFKEENSKAHEVRTHLSSSTKDCEASAE